MRCHFLKSTTLDFYFLFWKDQDSPQEGVATMRTFRKENHQIYIYFWEEIHTILRGVHDILRFLGRSSHNMGRCRLRLERVHDIYGFLGKKIIHLKKKKKKIQIGTTTTCIQSLGGGDRRLWIAQEEDQEEIMTLLEEEAWSPLDLEIGG